MATISGVFAYFSDNKTNDLTLTQFSKEWRELSDESREQIKGGIEDGTPNY